MAWACIKKQACQVLINIMEDLQSWKEKTLFGFGFLVIIPQVYIFFLPPTTVNVQVMKMNSGFDQVAWRTSTLDVLIIVIHARVPSWSLTCVPINVGIVATLSTYQGRYIIKLCYYWNEVMHAKVNTVCVYIYIYTQTFVLVWRLFFSTQFTGNTKICISIYILVVMVNII